MDYFPTIDEVHDMLEDIAEEVPKVFYGGLNGGVILDENVKFHPDSRDERPLYVLGEYRHINLTRTIVIYYGSFKMSYPYETHSGIYDSLRHTLIHEFTHHLESLAGKDDLGMEDKRNLRKYKDGFIDRED